MFSSCTCNKATSLPARAGDVRISGRADEGRKAGGRFSDSGGAATFLRGTHAGRQRLTLSTIVNKFKKPSPFLDDFLMNPQIQKFDAVQSRQSACCRRKRKWRRRAPDLSASLPAVCRAQHYRARERTRESRFGRSRITRRWREPLQLSASAIESYQKCPMQYLFERVWRHSRWAKRGR